MSAWVSPPHARTSHIVVTAPSIAQAASTAFPPFWNIMAPASAERGLPVIAIQCRACSGGFCVRAAWSGVARRHAPIIAMTIGNRVLWLIDVLAFDRMAGHLRIGRFMVPGPEVYYQRYVGQGLCAGRRRGGIC